LTFAYSNARGLDVGVIRIFNTYGPRMSPRDGRVVTNFITQALNGDPITIYGKGTQTRSFCYVDDLIRGVVAMMDSAERGPVNLGNPEEFSIADLAKLILRITGSSSPVEYLPLPVDDPARRCPDISRSRRTLGWQPEIPAGEGLRRMAGWLLLRADVGMPG
jgi:dTDP-glucose 4,6-dehydratase